MSRKKRLILNTTWSLVYQVVSVICGFVLPRLILESYGSGVNGLVSSISHLLGFFTLCECGMGAVIQSSLYRPLVDRNETEISKIMSSAQKFFNIVAYILVAYIVILAFVFPRIIDDSFTTKFSVLLLLAMSISYFAQYYFGISYKILLQADQRAYIQYIVSTIVLILNVVFSAILIRVGRSIQLVKLVASILFLAQPLVMVIYVKKYYRIDKQVTYTEEPIKQKWNGMAQHIANVILTNTDTTVLTILSTLENVSIYSVYKLVVNGLTQLLTSISTGLKSFLGNVLYSENHEKLLRVFSGIEGFIHWITTLLFGLCIILIVPFVKVYTLGIDDAYYIMPLFSVLITLGQAIYCIRLPYSLIIQAAGHYKETQWSALIETAINVLLTVITVIKCGLIGVAIGTLAAVTYRTIYFAIYLRKQILVRSIIHFVKHIVIDAVSIIVMYLSTLWVDLGTVTFLSWIKMALTVAIICFIESIIINILLNFKSMKNFVEIFMVKKNNEEKIKYSK